MTNKRKHRLGTLNCLSCYSVL